MVVALILVMEVEYVEVYNDLEDIVVLMYNFMLLEGVCISWMNFYNGLKIFVIDLINYIELENEVLFVRVLRGD